jgi:hypothetical protein
LGGRAEVHAPTKLDLSQAGTCSRHLLPRTDRTFLGWSALLPCPDDAVEGAGEQVSGASSFKAQTLVRALLPLFGCGFTSLLCLSPALSSEARIVNWLRWFQRRTHSGRAKADGKLIPVKTSELTYADIPLPFGEMHTENVASTELIRAAIVAQLAKPLVPQSPFWQIGKLFNTMF